MTAFTDPETAALARLAQYNAAVYSPANPLGMAGDGYKINWVAALADSSLVANAIARLLGAADADLAQIAQAVSTVAGSVTAAAASVTKADQSAQKAGQSALDAAAAQAGASDTLAQTQAAGRDALAQMRAEVAKIQGGPVVSVCGKPGPNIVLTAADVGAAPAGTPAPTNADDALLLAYLDM